jgi:hypothetical protein
MSEYGASRVREKLVWQHSVPSLLAAYDAVFRPLEVGTAPVRDARSISDQVESPDRR